mgnify:CR=1 FL=1
MRSKKIVSRVVVAAMTMAMVTGCGLGNNVSDRTQQSGGNALTDAAGTEVQKVDLKVWVPEEEVELTTQMCGVFNELHPEFDCTFDISIVGIDESCDLLTTDADSAADVFQIPSGSISQMVGAGLLYPITYDEDNVKGLYSEGAVDASSSDGVLYGIPFSPNSWFMYYDKSKYTEDEVKNLDIMMAKDLGEDVANFSCTISNSWYIEAFFYAAGCTLYGEDGTNPDDCTWNDENGMKAGKYLIDLANNPKYVEDIDGIAGSMIKDGKLAAFCSGTWAAADAKEAFGDNYAACALPAITLDGKECQLSNFADYKCYGVKSSTAYPLAAQLLAEYLGNEENQLTRYRVNATTPTCLSLQDNEEIADDPATMALMAQSEFATPQPAITQISEYWTPAEALGKGIINGEITEDNLQMSLDTVATSVTTKLAE